MRTMAAIMLCVACSGEPSAELLPPGDLERTAWLTPASAERVAAPRATPEPLTIEFLGVGGFLLTRGDEQVMTPPLFTRPSLIDVNTGKEVRSDVASISARFPRSRISGLRAVLVGHAHYDHLIDAPAVQLNADRPMLYGNQSMKNLLAALFVSRPSGCAAAGPRAVTLEDERVVAVEQFVDYRNCPSLKPDGAPLEGTWVRVPNSNIRFMALCSDHPDQFGPVHFAPGSVEMPQCELPSRADAWKEGMTLSYLVDFLDPVTGLPSLRVYYQDSPGKDPMGLVPPELLDEKRVDVALLCVGSYQNVANEPTATLTAMAPRFALGGHWEDFFRSVDQTPSPIPFTDMQQWESRARTAMPGGEGAPLERNGVALTERVLRPMPGDVFTVSTGL